MIVYFTGAGASANILPVIGENYISRIRDFISALSRVEGVKLETDEWNEIIDNCDKYGTPDTYARRLWLLNEQDEYKKLKRLLSCYFIGEQIESIQGSYHDKKAFSKFQNSFGQKPAEWHKKRRYVDDRYTAFLSSILSKDKDDQLGSKVKFVTWNYDLQMEKAYSMFSNQEEIKKIMSSLDDFQISINGKGWFSENGLDCFNFKNYILDDERLKYLRDYLEPQRKGADNLLKFAWENENFNKNESLVKAQKWLSQATAVVIVGYSFPSFNRKVDQFLFSRCKPSKGFYIQDKYPEKVAEKIAGIGRHLKGFRLTPESDRLIRDVGQFHIPNEYWHLPE